eukprot:30350-Alexandrium_andersonii.AAC.1
MSWLGMAWFGLALLGLAWPWPGLAALAWPGLAWLVSAWPGQEARIRMSWNFAVLRTATFD